MASRPAATYGNDTHYQYGVIYGDGIRQQLAAPPSLEEAQKLAQLERFHQENLMYDSTYFGSPQAQILAAQNVVSNPTANEDHKSILSSYEVTAAHQRVHEERKWRHINELKAVQQQRKLEGVMDLEYEAAPPRARTNIFEYFDLKPEIRPTASPGQHTNEHHVLHAQCRSSKAVLTSNVPQIRNTPISTQPPSDIKLLLPGYPSQPGQPILTKLLPHQAKRNYGEMAEKTATDKTSSAQGTSLVPIVSQNSSRRCQFRQALITARTQILDYKLNHFDNNQSSILKRRDSSANTKHKKIHCCHVKKSATHLENELLQCSAIRPNEKDSSGKTPLHYAALSQHIPPEAITVLFDQGERIDVKDHLGFTPWQYAFAHQAKENVLVFIEQLAKHVTDEIRIIEIVAWHFAAEKGYLIPQQFNFIKEVALPIYAETSLFRSDIT
ncbi:ankyrin repeat domain-containing protein [Parashewanella tropica]|uniref:ankyrin repeat domain-containing protein n=1 Tax=Parashewanella tropica TaxID=2547970 RepID=UPI001059EF1A|nr:ankyrin repeat domain-containing protein [Parashewanella tropica]